MKISTYQLPINIKYIFNMKFQYIVFTFLKWNAFVIFLSINQVFVRNQYHIMIYLKAEHKFDLSDILLLFEYV